MTKEEKLLGFLNSAQYKPMSAEEIKLCLNVSKDDEKLFYDILLNLHKSGKVLKNKHGLYKANSKKTVSGKLHLVKTGGFVKTDDENEIFINSYDLNGAFEDDIVIVVITKDKTVDKSPEGYVEKILKRGIKTIVGKYTNIYGIVGFVPFDMRLPVERFIMLKDGTNSLQNEDMIVADVVSYPSDGCAMTVKFKEKISSKTDLGADTSCLIKIFDIPDKFSDATLEYARNLPSEVELSFDNREDFRKDRVITIDGEDARDLDDAICVKKIDNGYRLFVHIADVSHYVEFNSSIDKDARLRATSVYFPDRVVPMLPKELSNGICSLNPNVDRLTLSVIMDIDKDGEFISYRITKGIIRSCERMTYTDVTSLLDETADDDKQKRYSHILNDLKLMSELYKILKRRRIKQGYISFDIPEAKFSLDEHGRAVDVFKYESGISNEIIEQFMLMANEAVAKFGVKHNLPFVYRVHEKPDGDKENNLRNILHFHSIHLKEEITSIAVSEAISKLSGREDFYAISSYILRCMTKARYDTENLGHFGLGCENYLHFTSPIRRYPDLQVHRIISYYLTGELKSKLEQMQAFSGEAAIFSTDAEIRATEAEREADKLKACEYMTGFLGEKFTGIISSVADFGIFVMLPNAVEGFVPLAELKDDYYIFEKESYRLIGKRTKKTFSLGDIIEVRIADVDIGLRRIDFSVPHTGYSQKSGEYRKRSKPSAAKKAIEEKRKRATLGRKARKNISKKRKRK